MHAHPPSTTTSVPPPHETLKEVEKEKSLERNIDSVLFGDILFKAWYPSWYPKEVLGEKGLEGKGAVVKRLYVCERCFGYTKVCGEFVRHVRGGCGREIPGRKVYVHGGYKEVEHVDDEGTNAVNGQNKGGWEVWEVDGDVDTVCSHPSPFLTKQTRTKIAILRSSAKTSPSSLNSSSTTNPSSSTSPPSSTTSSYTSPPPPASVKSSDSSPKRKCPGTPTI